MTPDPADSMLRNELPPDANQSTLKDWASLLVEQARRDRVALTGDGGLLTDLVRKVLETGLEVELTEHLGYEPHAVEGRGSGNSRNPKTVATVRPVAGAARY